MRGSVNYKEGKSSYKPKRRLRDDNIEGEVKVLDKAYTSDIVGGIVLENNANDIVDEDIIVA